MKLSKLLNIILISTIIWMLISFRTSPLYFSKKNLKGSFKRILQNIIRGWNNSDIWNLDGTICKFILPRLKEYRKNIRSYPTCIIANSSSSDGYNEEEFKFNVLKWKGIIDKMIFSFEEYLTVGYSIGNKRNEKDKQISEGLQLFAKYFQCLWD